MSIVLFEDELVSRLDPVAIGKPAFAISCGVSRLVDLLAGCGRPLHARVRDHLTAIVASDYPEFQAGAIDVRSPSLWVNARLVPSVQNQELLFEILKRGRPGIVRSNASIAVALVPAGTEVDEDFRGRPPLDSFSALGLPALEAELPLFEYAHDVIRHHLQTLGANLERRIARGNYRQHADGVFLADGATLGDYVVTDTRRGPIVLEPGATDRAL